MPSIAPKPRTIHVFQHVPYEAPDLIQKWAQSRGIRLEIIPLWQNGLIPELNEIEALLIMGGPMNVDEVDAFPWLVPEVTLIRNVLQKKRKVFGICLGAQLIAKALGARVYKNPQAEIGWFPVEFNEKKPSWFEHFSKNEVVFHWHGDTFDLPDGAVNFVSTATTHHQGFYVGDYALGLQFHIEVSHDGIVVFESYLRKDVEQNKGHFIQDLDTIWKNTEDSRLKEKLFSFLDAFY